VSAIFISHSSRDAAAAEEVLARLREHGHRSVFLDFDPENGIPAGRDWEQELYRRLRACQAMIVLCSEHTMASHWCFAEITHAKSLGKQVFPVKIAPCEINPILTSRQILDLTQDEEETYDRLWRGLRAAGLDPANAFDWDGSRPPYPGLLAFQEEDAAVFFGREREIHEGLEQLRRLQRFGRARLLMVLGASGSGKSSLVRAGLLPRLRRSAESWIVVDPFRPRDDPFREFAAALSRTLERAGTGRPRQRIEERLRRWEAGAPAAPAAARPRDEAPLAAALAALEAALRGRANPAAARHLDLLRAALETPGAEVREAAEPSDAAAEAGGLGALVADLRLGSHRPDAQVLVTIDQFEELLGCPDDHPGISFLRLVRAALDDPAGAVVILATMRSDYLGEFQKAPALVGLQFESLSLGPMPPESIAQTVDHPARAAGLDLEPGLTEALVEDARGEEALPLLAFTLRELWERHAEEGRLAVHQYRGELGGLSGSVARAADGVLGVDELPPEIERDLRKAFLQMVRLTEGGRFARRPARWRDVLEAVHEVLERFVQARLLVSRDEDGERVVEVAHEALFRSWVRLRSWLDADREFLLWRERLRTARAQWQQTGFDEGALLRGVALEEARKWLAERPEGLAEEREFIERSIALQRERQAAVQRRRRRTLLAAVGAAAVFLTLAALAWQESLAARRSAVEQRAALLAKTAEDVRDPLLGAHLLLAGADLVDGREPSGGGRAARYTAGQPIARSVLRGHTDPVTTLAFSPDDQFLVTGSDDGTARVWRRDGTGRPVVLSGHEDRVTSVAFAPDGGRVLTASADGTARVWHADGTGAPVVLTGHGGELYGAAFSPDGARVVTASADGTARVWAAAGGGAPVVLEGHQGPVRWAAFSPDGAWVATGSEDRTARLWPADGSGRPIVLAGHDDWVWNGDFSPDGARLATASTDGTARIWGVGGGSEPVVLAGHEGWVWRAVFSRDGRSVATASADSTARIWRADGAGAPVVLDSHDDWVRDVAFGPGDATVLTASHDGTARVWAPSGERSSELAGHEGWVRSAAFSHDGAWVATVSDDATVRLWSAEVVPDPIVLEGHEHHVWDADFSGDGARIASASTDRTARVWSLAGGSPAVVLAGHTDRVRTAEFSPDDARVVTSSDDGSARIWSADGAGEPVLLLGHSDKVLDATWSPDGARVATASYDRTVRLWDAAGGRPLGVLEGHRDWVRSVQFSRDGSKLLTASADRTIGLWRANGSGEPRFFRGHTDQVMIARFSPDESKIVSASADRTIRVWNADGTGEPLVLEGHEGLVWSASFSPDGARIVSASSDWTARVWNADGSGEPIYLGWYDGPVWHAAFSDDGGHVATASADRVVRIWRLWRLDWPELVATLRRGSNACFAPDHRVRYLFESPEQAREAYEECERGFGRQPEPG